MGRVCTCFSRSLPFGEITVSSLSNYDSSTHLSYGDTTFDTDNNPSMGQIIIKASRTDPFRKGVILYSGCTDIDLCSVAALAAYITIKGSQPGPFFMLKYRESAS